MRSPINVSRTPLLPSRWDPGAAAGVTVAGGGSELSFPAGIAVDAGRRQIYVADTGRQRIQRYQLDASYGPQGGGVTVAGVDKAAGDETDLTKLNNPTAVLFDTKNDRLYVADARNKRVLSWPFDSLSGSEGKVAQRPATAGSHLESRVNRARSRHHRSHNTSL